MTAVRSRVVRLLAVAGVVASPAIVVAQDPPPDTQDKAMARHLEAARAPAATPDPSLWMHNLALDLRARRVNDLVTVRVEESIAASGTADSSLAKSSSAAVAVPSLFGLETKLPSVVNPNNLASSQSDTGFTGGGSTTRTSVLTATMSARVATVLPNGDLVLEGVREIEINGERQVVVLSGIARVVDIGPGNVVSSMQLGQLRIRYFGKGLTRNSLTPGWLIRVLNKIF